VTTNTSSSTQAEAAPLSAQAFWIMLAKTLAFSFTLALPLLLVRRLSQEDFGLYKQIFLLVNTAFGLLPLGLGMSAYYFLPREPERQPQIVFNIFLFLLTVSATFCAVITLFPSLLLRLFNSSEVAGFAPLIGLVVVTWITSSLLEVIAVARRELRLATLLIILSQLSKAAFMLGAVALFGSVRSLLYAALLQGVVQTAVLVVYLRSRFGQFWRRFDWTLCRVQLAYALPFGFASMLLRTQTELDNYFVSYQFGPAAYAIYAVGCFELPLLALLAESISSVTIPRVSYLQQAGARQEIVELVARVTRKLSLVLLPLYVLLLVVGREFITFLFTEQYAASWPIFAFNLTLIPLLLITSAYDPVMRAYADHRYFMLKLRMVLLVVMVTGLVFATARFGLVGAIAVNILINLADRVAVAFKVKRILDIGRRDLPLFGDIGRVAVLSLAAGVVTLAMRALLAEARPFYVLAAGGVVFSVVYAAGVLALGVLTPEERETVHRRFMFWHRPGPPKRAAGQPV
jgi:O-antigen/teichoic acid export membrane protein